MELHGITVHMLLDSGGDSAATAAGSAGQRQARTAPGKACSVAGTEPCMKGVLPGAVERSRVRVRSFRKDLPDLGRRGSVFDARRFAADCGRSLPTKRLSWHSYLLNVFFFFRFKLCGVSLW